MNAGPGRPCRPRTDQAVPAHAGAVLTLLRHGQSVWNRDGRFTGWADVGLSERGRAEAARAGRLLARTGLRVDVCVASMLARAAQTTEIALGELGQPGLRVERTWRLNERHYGALEGLRVWTALRRYGPRRVLRCRRRADARPPRLRPGDPRHPSRDPRYAATAPEALPRGESLVETEARLLPYWESRIAPELARGRHVLVVSHKHALRVLLAALRRRAPGCIPPLRVSTGVPLVIRLGHEDLDALAGGGARAAGSAS